MNLTNSSTGLRNVCTFPAKTRSKVANITTRGELGVIRKAAMCNPKKPKYYKLRQYSPFVGFFVFLVSLNLIESTVTKVVFLVAFICLTFILRYLFNPDEVNKYSKYEMDLEAQELRDKVIESNVNENISRYLEEQRKIKENAKWWQFWI